MNFKHKKSLGQNFLNSDYAPKKMCDAASLKDGELVLEIGPGTGALTKELLKRKVRVLALEADIRAIEQLQVTFEAEISSGQLTVIHTDARKIDFEELGLQKQGYKVVANIPYYLSGLLFRTFLETEVQPSTLVFLVQKEVAERISRDPKESLLSISVKVFGEPKYVATIKKGHFTPSPKVDSAIISIENISTERLEGVNPRDFFEILHLGFGQKRKQLVANLSKKFDRNLILQALSDLDLLPTVRAEDVTPKKWVTLVSTLS